MFVVTELFNIAVNDIDAKESLRCRQVLVVTEPVLKHQRIFMNHLALYLIFSLIGSIQNPHAVLVFFPLGACTNVLFNEILSLLSQLQTAS